MGGALVISGLVLFLGGLIPTKQINFYKNIIKVYTHKIHVSKVKNSTITKFLKLRLTSWDTVCHLDFFILQLDARFIVLVTVSFLTACGYV